MAWVAQAVAHVSGPEASHQLRIAVDTVGGCDRLASLAQRRPDTRTYVYEGRGFGAVQKARDRGNDIADIYPIPHLTTVFEQARGLPGFRFN